MEKKCVLASLLMLSILLTTCVYRPEERAVKEMYDELNNRELIITSDVINGDKLTNSENADDLQSEEGQGDSKNEKNDEEIKKSELASDEFLDIDSLENKPYAWELIFNKGEAIPEISSDVKEMMDKHGAIYLGDTSKKTIYLTFDEGYENGFTPSILDTLKKNDVKAIFFVTGHYIRNNADLVERMLKEGHKVGNHTMNHYSLPTLNKENFKKEIEDVETLISEKFGTKMEYLRPPKGEYSERVLAYCKQLGYRSVFWSFAYNDYEVNNQKGAQYAYDKVMGRLHNGAVILLHAVSKDNAEALEQIIKGIRQKGFEILPFDF